MQLLSTQVDWDMNGDGLFTISDIWLLEKWLLCLPGNFLLEVFQLNLPRAARFFEIHASMAASDSFYGVAAWLISLLSWLGLALLAPLCWHRVAGRGS
jgi:hypothetical protein